MNKLRDIWKVITNELSWEMYLDANDAHLEYYRKWTYANDELNQLKRDHRFALAGIQELKAQRNLLGGEAAIKKQSQEIGDRILADMKANPKKYIP